MTGKDFSSKGQLRPTELYKKIDDALNDTMDPPQGSTPAGEDGPENFEDKIAPDPHVLEQHPENVWKSAPLEEEMKESAPNLHERDTS